MLVITWMDDHDVVSMHGNRLGIMYQWTHTGMHEFSPDSPEPCFDATTRDDLIARILARYGD